MGCREIVGMGQRWSGRAAVAGQGATQFDHAVSLQLPHLTSPRILLHSISSASSNIYLRLSVLGIRRRGVGDVVGGGCCWRWVGELSWRSRQSRPKQSRVGRVDRRRRLFFDVT